MTDLRKAAEMALEALEDAETNNDGEARWDLHRAATEALRTALAQPEQTPFGYVYEINGTYTDFSKELPPDDGYDKGTLVPVFTTPPSTSGYAKKIESLIKERDELRQQMARGEQEPVAWMYVNEDGECEQIEYGVSTVEAPYIKLLYIAPPSKPWVSLTDREIEKAIVSTAPSFKPDDVAQAIEAALRSKNNG